MSINPKTNCVERYLDVLYIAVAVAVYDDNLLNEVCSGLMKTIYMSIYVSMCSVDMYTRTRWHTHRG